MKFHSAIKFKLLICLSYESNLVKTKSDNMTKNKTVK